MFMFKIRVRIHQPFLRTFFFFFSKICKLKCNTTSDWLNHMVCQSELFYIQMLLDIEKSGEYDKQCSKEWLVNTGPDLCRPTLDLLCPK